VPGETGLGQLICALRGQDLSQITAGRCLQPSPYEFPRDRWSKVGVARPISAQQAIDVFVEPVCPRVGGLPSAKFRCWWSTSSFLWR